MVGEQASLITAHAKMIDENGAGCCWFRGGVKRALEGSKDVENVFVEVTYFVRRFSNELGLVVRQMS